MSLMEKISKLCARETRSVANSVVAIFQDNDDLRAEVTGLKMKLAAETARADAEERHAVQERNYAIQLQEQLSRMQERFRPLLEGAGKVLLDTKHESREPLRLVEGERDEVRAA